MARQIQVKEFTTVVELKETILKALGKNVPTQEASQACREAAGALLQGEPVTEVLAPKTAAEVKKEEVAKKAK